MAFSLLLFRRSHVNEFYGLIQLAHHCSPTDNRKIADNFCFFPFVCYSKRKPRRRTNSNSMPAISAQQQPKLGQSVDVGKAKAIYVAVAAPEPDSDDPKGSAAIELNDDKPAWSWRVAKYAFPVQMAIVALFCAACFLEPHCCDGLNNYAWSLTPQLRYVRGPPPI